MRAVGIASVLGASGTVCAQFARGAELAPVQPSADAGVPEASDGTEADTGPRGPATEPQDAPVEADDPLGTAEETAPEPELVPPVGVRADNVTLDAKRKELHLAGNVRIESGPFFLKSDALTLQRSPIGAVLEGEGTMGFCPCLGTPLSVSFGGATVAPPDDLILKKPVLRVFGLPVLYSPIFWLRSPGRPGLLPPEVAYRAQDGLFAGGGVHLPWARGDADNGLDARAGAYLVGGFRAELSLRTPASVTDVRLDHLRRTGLGVSAYGSIDREAQKGASDARSGKAGTAWSVDALRGRRSVEAATDVRDAAKPFDRASVEAFLRARGITMSSGLRSVSLRGGRFENADVVAPVATLRAHGAVAPNMVADALLEGTTLASAKGSMSLLRGEGGLLLADQYGPVASSTHARVFGQIGVDGDRSSRDGVGVLRTSLSLPFARKYAVPDQAPGDYLVHRIDPRVGGAAIGAIHDDPFTSAANPAAALQPNVLPLLGRGASQVAKTAVLGEAGWSSSLGRRGKRRGGNLGSTLAIVGTETQTSLVTRGRAAGNLGLLAGSGELASVVPAFGAKPGLFVVGRTRIGDPDGLFVSVTGTFRRGIDPIAARLLDSNYEPGASFVSDVGTTLGSSLGVPLGSRLALRGGADFDVERRELLGARGAIDLRDGCGCLVLRTQGSTRMGREGIDVWVTLDVRPEAFANR